MSMQAPASLTLTLSGNNLNRVTQLLALAQRFSRVAGDGYGPRVQDALVDLENEISDRLAAIENAEQDDKAEAAEVGTGESTRLAYSPHYQAA